METKANVGTAMFHLSSSWGCIRSLRVQLTNGNVLLATQAAGSFMHITDVRDILLLMLCSQMEEREGKIYLTFFFFYTFNALVQFYLLIH